MFKTFVSLLSGQASYDVSLNYLKPKVSKSGDVYGAAKSQELNLLRGVAVFD
jgi:hypothetical protein